MSRSSVAMGGSQLDAGPDALAPALPATIGPYRITGILGVGGMGAVYRGVHPDQHETVAIKTVSAPRESLLPAIRREIHTLRKLRHPCVVRIRDSGAHGGIPWYAMDLLEPRSLADLGDELRSRNAGAPPTPDAVREVLTIVRRLCEPLAYVHGEGIVHGDIKPSNVLLRGPQTSDAGAAPAATPVLIDFGLLTTFGEQPGRDTVDAEHRAAGSVAYMAPEQIDGEPVDARADLYAVGCLLYELLTGQPPFDEARVDDMLRAHRERAPLPPSAHGLPRALDDLVLGLLAKRPRDRIGYADDVAARLSALGAEAYAQAPERAPRPRPYLYRPSLTGRRQPLETLAAEIAARFGASQGGMAFVVGESGVGKTRLAIELARRAKSLGARVLSGGSAPRAANGGGALHALARPLQAIADRCHAEGPEETRRLLGGRIKLLARYEPSLASLPGQGAEPEPPELPIAAARALVSHELCATFEALCEGQPLLLVLDDLQWADELTLAFLAKLADLATFSRARLFVLGAVRSDEIGAALGALLAASTAARIDLGRLDAEGVSAMVSEMLAHPSPSDAFIRFIARHTEGNPFFIAEYLRAAVNEGLLLRDGRGRFQIAADDDASLASLPLPRSLRDVVARRLDGLDEGARRVVELAAVVGREVDPALVSGVLAIDSAAWTQITSELCERLVLEDTGDELRFSHDKIRDVAYERLDEEARAALHRAAAAALDARHDTRPAAKGAAEAAAYHWLAAGDGPKAVPLLLAAARRSLLDCDNERTIDLYMRALAVLQTTGSGAGASADAALRFELERRRSLWEEPSDPGAVPLTEGASALREALRKAHRGLGDALTVIGRYDEALDEYGAAMRHGTGDEARADALGRMAAVRFAKGELLVAARHLRDALDHLGQRLPESRAGVLASIGASAIVLTGRLVRRRQVESDRARAVESLRVRLLNRLTYIHYSFSFERMVQTHLLALAAAERIASTPQAAETFAHHGPAFASLVPWSARRYARRAVTVCKREGHLAMQMTAELMAGICFMFQARWREAIDHFRSAISLYPRVGDLIILQRARERLAYVLLYRGDHDDALIEASRALDLAERAGDLRGTCNSRCWVALACLRLGDLPRARRVADEAAECLATLDDRIVHCIVHTLLGRIARAADERAEARAAFERAVAIAEEHRLAQEEVAPAYTELLEELAGGPNTVAQAGAAQAGAATTAPLLRKARSFGRRFPAHEGSRLRTEALLLARRGQLREAHQRMSLALDILRDRGMRHELARTLEAMATLEQGPASAQARERALHLYRETGSQADARRVERTFGAEPPSTRG